MQVLPDRRGKMANFAVSAGEKEHGGEATLNGSVMKKRKTFCARGEKKYGKGQGSL